MVNFYETRSYWQGGFAEDKPKYYKEYLLYKKWIFIWKIINQLNSYARNLCSDYEKYFCCGESCWCMMFKHLPFQGWCNDNETLASYTKVHYNLFDVEQIEEFVVFKGAYEIASFVENIDDTPYKFESLDILKYLLRILMIILILLTISKGSLPQRMRLMLCRTLWKKKLLKRKAPWMKKRRRMANKRRKNGVATHSTF